MNPPLASLAWLGSGHPGLAPATELAVARRIVESSDGTEQQGVTRARILAFTDEHPQALHRSCEPGHLTGSALVVDATGEQTLLLFHTKLQRWLQPGGHADGDANLAAVAWREATEETGIEGLQVLPRPIDLDIHTVNPPGEPPHEHLDVRYLVVAPPGAEPAGNHESQALAWVRLDELAGADLDLDPGILRMARVCQQIWSSLPSPT